MRKGVENTNIKVVGEVAADFDRLKAVGAMEDLLQTHPNLDAVFATNDQMALGAIEALQTYQSDAILVGVDGAVEATQAIIGATWRHRGAEPLRDGEGRCPAGHKGRERQVYRPQDQYRHHARHERECAQVSQDKRGAAGSLLGVEE